MSKVNEVTETKQQARANVVTGTKEKAKENGGSLYRYERHTIANGSLPLCVSFDEISGLFGKGFKLRSIRFRNQGSTTSEGDEMVTLKSNELTDSETLLITSTRREYLPGGEEAPPTVEYANSKFLVVTDAKELPPGNFSKTAQWTGGNWCKGGW